MQGVAGDTWNARTFVASFVRSRVTSMLFRSLWGAGLLAGTLISAPCHAQRADPAGSKIARPDRDPITGIVIEGNTTIAESDIRRHIRTQTGRVADPGQVLEDKRQLWETRWFYSVETRFRQTDRGPVLVFRVHERPIVRRVEYKVERGRYFSPLGTVRQKHLEAWTGLREGSPVDVHANRMAARQIEQRYREKGFPFVEVTLEKGDQPDDREVVFRIREGPKTKVTRRRITGNQFVSNARLAVQLKTKSAILGFGGRYEPANVNDDVAILKQYYQGLGFFDITIAGEPRFSDDRSRVVMEYTVDEGPRYRIRNVRMVGNRVLTGRNLIPEPDVAAGEFFNVRFLNSDLAVMRKRYGELGRLYAQVEAIPRFLEEPGVVDIEYRIDEDRVYYVRRVDVKLAGDHPHTRETTLLDRSRIFPGDLADPRMIRLTQRRLEGSQVVDSAPGSVRIDIRPVTETAESGLGNVFRGQDDDRRPASVPFGDSLFSPAPWVPTEQDNIGAAGAGFPTRMFPDNPHPAARRWRTDDSFTTSFRRTDDMPSLRESVYRPSSPDTVFRGQNFDGPFRTPNNPVFDNSPLGDPLGRSIREPPPGLADVIIHAQEGRTGRMMFGFGVNSDAGIVGSFVVDESNFDIRRPPTSWRDVLEGRAWRGGGQRLRLEAVPGDLVSRYMVTWTDPFFMHSDFSLSLSGFYFTRFYEDWDERRGGGRIGVGRMLGPEWSVSTEIRLEEVDFANPRPTSAVIPTPPAIAGQALGNSFLSTGRVSLSHDTRDAQFGPTEGHFCQISYEQAFGEFHFPRFEGELRQYFPVHSRPDGSGQQVFSVTGNVGWTGSDTPIFERYFLGGFQSFRGFDFRGVTPRVGDFGIGGRWQAYGSAEYLLPLSANDMIAVVAFTDFGTVENNTGLDDFRATVGVGLRITVPGMGPVPLAFDFGVPLAYEQSDERRIFSFYVGINR